MMQSFHSYKSKLYESGLVPPGETVFGIIRDDTHVKVFFGRKNGERAILSALMDHLPAKALVFAKPAEPYHTITEYLAKSASHTIYPDDSETRTFLGDLPVVRDFSIDPIKKLLSDRKCLIIPGRGILALGITGPKDAYTAFSAACFASFVKFFNDFLVDSRKKVKITENRHRTFARCVENLPPVSVFDGGLMTGPFDNRKDACNAMIETGARIVSLGLVDACFGNISYRVDDNLYISKTGSFLDELSGDIAMCRTDDPKCADQRPSSEYPAHREIIRNSDFRGVLHGHPLFSVIMSMDCHIECDHRGECHQRCPHYREIGGVPIVSGETGGGPQGLSATVPGMIKTSSSVIVYGHGVFTATRDDFNTALGRIVDIEKMCRREYFKTAGVLGSD